MDPEGVREVFYAECGGAADYGIRDAIRSLPFSARFNESFFFGLHLPLTRPLPKRLDVGLQQHTGLHAYDAVVLADIDPVVFDADDLLNLLAYVEAGGGLMLFGGPNSFSLAQRNWGPLREALPASIGHLHQIRQPIVHEHTHEKKTYSKVSLKRPHAIARGLSGALGSVSTIHPIKPKEHATVLAIADGKPLIVAGVHGWGRVLIVASHPDDGPDSMFRTPGYADLLRQAMMWLMGRPGDLVIQGCSIDHSPMRLGEARELSIELTPEAPLPFEAGAMVSRADPGWLAAGREPQFGPAEQMAVEVTDHRARFNFEPQTPGLWRVHIALQGGDWANARIADIRVGAPLGLRLSTRHGEYVTAPGWTLPLHLTAQGEVQASLRIVDFDGGEVWRQDGVTTGPIDVALPELELGDYEAIAQCDGESAHLRFCVTNPLRRVGFSLVAHVGGATEERVRWWYDYFRSRGFDGFATGLPTLDRGSDPPPRPLMLAYQHYLVQRDGLDLWGEYTGASLLSTHSHHGEEGTQPTEPCILDPRHAVKLRRFLEAKFRAASCLPRMTSLEILDEPHLYRANVCHCDRCQSEYEKRYGYKMPTWDQAIAARDRRTRDYFEWVVDYAARAFKMGYEIWRSFGRGPKMHHVLCAMGNGLISANNGIAEDLPWAEHADFIEFDCYNYMYPHWRPLGQLRWNEFHYMMGHFRFLALRNKQQIGFFIQVTDRDLPVTPPDPLRAPSETLYTAIGSGAKTFHLMHKSAFTSSQNCREDKFDTLAQDIRKVQKLAPLLDRAQSPRSRIATVFPFHDRLYRFPEHRLPGGYTGLGYYGIEHRPYDTLWPYHKAPINVTEMLFRAFGEVDVIDQRALREGALDDYQGFALAGIDYIADEDAHAVARFVQRGGALICDHIPSHNLDGKALTSLQSLFGSGAEHFYKEVRMTRSQVGNGNTLLFSEDLNELYTGSVERDEPVLRYRLKETIREFLFDNGLRPHALGDNYEIEANVLLTPDTIVLVAVNHAEDRQRSRVTLYAPALPVAHVYDLVTMRPFAFSRNGDDIVIDVALDEREGVILGLYAQVPAKLAIVPDSEPFRRGDRLAFNIAMTDLSGNCVRGDHIVELCVADPRGQERRQFGGLKCVTNGNLRIDEPLAVNARIGEWTITAFDRFTTQQARASVTVTDGA